MFQVDFMQEKSIISGKCLQFSVEKFFWKFWKNLPKTWTMVESFYNAVASWKFATLIKQLSIIDVFQWIFRKPHNCNLYGTIMTAASETNGNVHSNMGRKVLLWAYVPKRCDKQLWKSSVLTAGVNATSKLFCNL